jgi:hypothetical protein
MAASASLPPRQSGRVTERDRAAVRIDVLGGSLSPAI